MFRGPNLQKAEDWRAMILEPEYDSERFRRTFRITRATFEHILLHIRNRLEKGPHESKVGKPRTPAAFQLAATLAYVANGQPYCTIGDLLGLGERTVGESVRQVSNAIIDVFQQTINLPGQNSEEWTRIASKFSELGGLPNVGLAFDGSYIKVEVPGAMVRLPGVESSLPGHVLYDY
ncbi:hypothetical protein BDR26DRAFT_929227 [Obelidium mucronatum]|nr:hypothetical protein BDR26DRAFT_929227 [Obelidium mucronatum]